MERLQETMLEVEQLMQDRELFTRKVRENESSFKELCKHVNEAKSIAEKERDELNSQLEKLKHKMESQSTLIQQLNEQVGSARQNVRTQQEKLETFLKLQETDEK